METHADYQAASGKSLAANVPEDVLAIVRQHRPDVAEDIERACSIKRSRIVTDSTPEDKIADDYSWLWDFEYEGQRLTAKEIDFVITFAKQGFTGSITVAEKTGLGAKDPWARPRVLAALHEATKSMARQWQISSAKIGRQLFNVVNSNISDVCDITPAGVVLKDFNKLPRHITDAVQEVHEIRNAQGTQIRVKFYDKLAAANIMLRVLNAFPKETIQVEVSGLEDKLASAIQRLRNDDMKDIEGELVVDH